MKLHASGEDYLETILVLQGKLFFQINRSTDRTNRLFLSWLSRRSFSFADLCYENKTRSQKLNLDNKCFQQL